MAEPLGLKIGGTRLGASFRKAVSPSSHGAEDNERFGAGGDGVGEGSVGRVVGKVLCTGEEANEGAAFLRDVIADGSAQHWIARLEGVEDGTLCNRRRDLELDLAFDLCQFLKMERECDPNHRV